ncbi:MAG: cysteine rich repeat-containing protein [Pseudomonadota bacterium]
MEVLMSKYIKSVFCAAMGFALLGIAALAQETAQLPDTLFDNPNDRLTRACGQDMATYCSSVLPGDGRLGSCLYGHQDLLSEACYEANAEIGELLESVFDLFYGFYAACTIDLQTHCAKEEIAGARHVRCLMEKRQLASEACQSALPTVIP